MAEAPPSLNRQANQHRTHLNHGSVATDASRVGNATKLFECFRGPDAGKRISLHEDCLAVLARNPSAGIYSEDSEVDETGFRIEQRNGEVSIAATGALRAFVDGFPKSEAVIRPGMQIRLGTSYWKVVQAEAPVVHDNDPGIIGSFANSVIRAGGLKELRGFRFSYLFTQALKRHKLEEIEEKFVCGTSTTTPAIHELSTEWPQPWLFVRWLFASLGVCAALLFALIKYDNPLLFPGVIMAFSAAVPMATLMLFWELHIVRNVSPYHILKLLFLGGTLSVFLSLLLFEVTGLTQWLAASAAGIVEEVGKLAIVVGLMHRFARFPWILNGMLFGAAVGTGFAVLETAGYITAQEDFSTAMLVAIGRALVSPFNHPVWTAAAAAALWRVKGSRPFDWSMITDGRFLRVMILVMVLHALWNAPFGWDWLYGFGKPIIWAVAGWAILLALLQEGLAQLRDAQINGSQVRDTMNRTQYEVLLPG
jgi:protease PrsW